MVIPVKLTAPPCPDVINLNPEQSAGNLFSSQSAEDPDPVVFRGLDPDLQHSVTSRDPGWDDPD